MWTKPARPQFLKSQESVMTEHACMHTYIHGILLSHKKIITLPFGTTWMNLECVMVNEKNGKDKYYISLTCET